MPSIPREAIEGDEILSGCININGVIKIIEQVNAVLFEGKNASEAVKELMVREGKSELTVLDWE